jgi:glycosyltransferase involved in cell wall biosynthesis
VSIPSISVVIPAFNAGRTLAATLDSVYDQSHQPQEVIIIDDCSTDNTGEIASSYALAGRNLPIKVIRQAVNRGPAAARNAGIVQAKSDWVAFLDGDDQWLPHKLACQLTVINEHSQSGLICSRTAPLQEGAANTAQCPHEQQSTTVDATKSTLLGLEDFIYANPVATSTVLVKRELLLKLNGFDERFKGPEDYDLWLRVAAQHEIRKISKALSLYRFVPGSLSMDERTFLPQVIGVLEQAFATGGTLEQYAHLRQRAYAEKYSSASWMAFRRGCRQNALKLLLKSYITYPRRIHPEERDPLLRVKLLWRYLLQSIPAISPLSPPPPRVAHLLLSLEHGGLEQCVLQWTLERNKRIPNSTIVICLDSLGPLARQLPTDICHTLNARRNRRPWDRTAVKKLRKLLKRHQIGIIHSHNTAPRQYAALALVGNKDIAHIYTDHGSNPHLTGIINRLRLALMKRRTNEYVAVSETAKRLLAEAESIPSTRIKLIRNGIQVQTEKQQRSRSAIRAIWGAKEQSIVIGYVGRLAYEKGLDRLLSAVAGIADKSRIKLVIIGGGPERTKLVGQAEALEISTIVEFTGSIANAREIMRGFDLFVLPSRSEGLPLAMLEAIAEGIPVAVTATGECATVIKNGEFGSLLPSDESEWPRILSKILTQLGSAEMRAITFRAQQHINQKYSIERTLNEYEDLYCNLL